MNKISIVVAASSNLVIGKDNTLPWHLPTDLKFFKQLTEGSNVIMGRKCWESIPAKFRPLPNRRNVVVSRNLDYPINGGVLIGDLIETLRILKEEPRNDEIFVIGGSEIYKQSFQYADKVYLTRILKEIEGDTFLEGFDENDWSIISSSETISENGFDYVFEEYIKKVF